MEHNESSAQPASNAPSRTELIQKYHQQLVGGIERIKAHLATPGQPMDKMLFLSKKQAELEGQLLLFRNKYMMLTKTSMPTEQQPRAEAPPNSSGAAQNQPSPSPPPPPPPSINRMMPPPSTFSPYPLPSYMSQQPPQLAFSFAPQPYGLGPLPIPPPTLPHHTQMRMMPAAATPPAPPQQPPMYGAFSPNILQPFFYGPQTASPMLNTHGPSSVYQRTSTLIGCQGISPAISALHSPSATSPLAAQDAPQLSAFQEPASTALPPSLPSSQPGTAALDSKTVQSRLPSPVSFVMNGSTALPSLPQTRPSSPPAQFIRRSALANKASKSISQLLDGIAEKAIGLQGFKWLTRYGSISLKDDGSEEELKRHMYLYLQLVVVSSCLAAKMAGRKTVSSEDLLASEVSAARTLPPIPLDMKTFPPKRIQKRCQLLTSKLVPSQISSSSTSGAKRALGKLFKKVKKSGAQSDSSLSHEEGALRPH